MRDDLDASIVVETSGSEGEDDDVDVARSGRRRGASASGASSERKPRANPLNVVGRFVQGALMRQQKDDDVKRAEKERKREERERDIEAKKVEKERAKYEREEAKRKETEQKEAMRRRLEVDRIEYEREKREASEAARTAALAAAAAAGMETSSSEIEERSPGTPEQRHPEPTTASTTAAASETPEKVHHLHLPNVHLPNVDDIKHQVHHIQDVLRDQGGRLKRNLDEQVHHLGEHVHHLGEHVGEHIHHAQENIRDTSGKVGKRLAKNKFLRAIAERVSPNAILMLAVAFFLAGLPDNRVRKVREHKRRELHSQKHREEERRRLEQQEAYDELEENAEEYGDGDEPAYIGRGPTPRGVYEIVEGDTLCSIAGCFNLALVEIIDKNGDVITNPDALEPGSRIRIY